MWTAIHCTADEHRPGIYSSILLASSSDLLLLICGNLGTCLPISHSASYHGLYFTLETLIFDVCSLRVQLFTLFTYVP